MSNSTDGKNQGSNSTGKLVVLTAQKIMYAISTGNNFTSARAVCGNCRTTDIRPEANYCPMCGRKFDG
jgi:hypothetical protein